MNKWSQYMFEREGFSCIESEFGIAAFKIMDMECYVAHVFILPEHRKKREASRLVDQIAEIGKAAGCKKLTCSAIPSLPGATESVTAQLLYGFKIKSSHESYIILEKEI